LVIFENVVFSSLGEKGLTELNSDFKVHFHDRHDEMNFTVKYVKYDNDGDRQILNIVDLDDFDKRKLPSPGFQVEMAVMDHDAPVPSKSRGSTIISIISPSMLEERPTQTRDESK
jgi:phosphatidylinositol-3,4,5-trisphosphate 3-phosphatase/dual-specificity protein phosphatase PTEN